MRTTTEECRKLGEIIAGKVNLSTGPAAVYLPLKGVSLIDTEGQPFCGKEEDEALFDAIRAKLDSNRAELIEMDTDINDEQFALAMANKLIAMLENR